MVTPDFFWQAAIQTTHFLKAGVTHHPLTSPPLIQNFQKYNKCLNSQIMGLVGWFFFSKIHGTPYMWYIFGKPWVREHQKL